MDQTNSPNPLAQIERAYEKDIKFKDIIENPVLKPISDISSLYKGQSLLVAKGLSDYFSIKDEIDNLFKLNDRYSATVIGALIQRLIYITSDIIHNQDVQRLELKKAMNEIVDIVQSEYCLRKEGDMVDSTTDISDILGEILKEPKLNLEDKK